MKRLAVALLGVGLFAAAVWLRVGVGDPVPAAPAHRARGCTFKAGERFAFRLRFEAEASAADTAAPSDRFSALMSWQVVEEPKPGQWLIRAAFASPTLVQALTPLEQRVTQPLEASFFLRIGSDCRFEGKGYARDWQPETRRFASSVLSPFELVLRDTAASWELEQSDGVGSYSATYQATELPDGSTSVSRKKLRYHQDERASGFGFQAQLLLATATATLEPTGRWLERASGEERVRLKAQGAVLADLTQRFSLTRDDAAFVRPPAADEPAKVDWQDPFAMPSHTHPAPRPEVVAWSVGDALKRFEAVYRQTAKGDAYAAALLLAEWLRAHPEGAAALLAQVRAGAIAELLRPALFLALEQCGTPEARAALSSALGDHALTEMDRARASSALSDVPTPTRESAQALVAAARSDASKLVASTSVRALGHLVGRADTLTPALRGELAEALRVELVNAQNDSRVVDVIDAIGNTGDARFTGQVAPRLADASPSMREHAVRSLRQMPAADAAPLLLERLGQEADPAVRAAIVETLLTLGVRDEPTMTRAGQWLATEPAPAVRAALVRWLGAAAAELPVAKAALVAQFRREPVPQVLQLIGQYVSADELR